MVCLFLIFIVLIQSSKGSEMGAAFGGSSQTIFGGRGAATFLNKLTTASAIFFMMTSLSLAVLSVNRGSIMPEKAPSQELPVKPFSDEVQGLPVEGGQEELQEFPAEPAEKE